MLEGSMSILWSHFGKSEVSRPQLEEGSLVSCIFPDEAIHYNIMKVTFPPFANNRKYPRIIIKPGREAALLRGHPWLFSGAVASVEGNPEPGETVVAVTHSGAPLAIGFFNPLSEITFRFTVPAAGQKG